MLQFEVRSPSGRNLARRQSFLAHFRDQIFFPPSFQETKKTQDRSRLILCPWNQQALGSTQGCVLLGGYPPKWGLRKPDYTHLSIGPVLHGPAFSGVGETCLWLKWEYRGQMTCADQRSDSKFSWCKQKLPERLRGCGSKFQQTAVFVYLGPRFQSQKPAG